MNKKSTLISIIVLIIGTLVINCAKSSVHLEGIFHTIIGDPQDFKGEPRYVYYITDKYGDNWIYIGITNNTNFIGGNNAWDFRLKKVKITGTYKKDNFFDANSIESI